MDVKESLQVIRALKATNSQKDKKQILNDALDNGVYDIFTLFNLAYDSMVTFGVKNLQSEHAVSTLWPTEKNNGMTEFLDLAQSLSRRVLTGHKALNAISTFVDGTDEAIWNELFGPCLSKDMRCGVTHTTINKVLKDHSKFTNNPDGDFPVEIRVWSVPLAIDSKKKPNHMNGQKLIDTKYDGIRLTTLLDKATGKATMYTRTGKINTNFYHITNLLEEIIDRIPESIILDGEMISNSFQKLMTQVNRKENVNTDDTRYALFDIITEEEFYGTKTTVLTDRNKNLEEFINNYWQDFSGTIFMAHKELVDLDYEDGQERMGYLFEEAVNDGYEGIMIKDPNSFYERKRSANWLKWKPTDSADLIIVDCIEGEAGKKREGLLGSFHVKGDHDGKPIDVHVGSGFSDEQLKHYWECRDQLIGSVVEVRFDCLSKKQGSDVYSLRFPRFVRFRDMNDGIKL